MWLREGTDRADRGVDDRMIVEEHRSIGMWVSFPQLHLRHSSTNLTQSSSRADDEGQPTANTQKDGYRTLANQNISKIPASGYAQRLAI